MVKVGRYEVPEDWPVRGEAGRTFNEKLKNGFFSAYMAGEVTIDVGYRGAFDDAVPILPHAIGVDLDYPGYDGKKLPFLDESVDTVYSSHMLEHVTDFRATIWDWHRVVRPGGFIVCVVPHQFALREKARVALFVVCRPQAVLHAGVITPRVRNIIAAKYLSGPTSAR